jgi:hypothetical protein
VMRREVGAGIDATCFEALQIAIDDEVLGRQHAADAPAVSVVSARAEDYRQAA